jgi:hypothetical protein
MKFSKPYRIEVKWLGDTKKADCCNEETSELYCVQFGKDKPCLCARCLVEYLRNEEARVVFPPISKKTAKDRKVYR